MYEIKRMYLDVHKRTINLDLWNEVKKTNIEVTLNFRYKSNVIVRKCYDFLHDCNAITMGMISEVYEYFMGE